MKKLIIAVALLQSLVAFAVPTVKRVVVRQMWPWSTNIRIEYTLEGAEAPVDIQLAFKDGETPLSNAAGYGALDGDVLYVGNGVHVITLDPIAAFGKGSAAIADFKVCVTPVATELPDNKVLYKIIDLDGATKGKITDVTRVDLLMGKWGAIETDYSKIGPEFSTTLTDVLIWTGVTQDEVYKTTKLVVRRIPAGTFMMGSPEGESERNVSPIAGATKAGETQHQVTLRKDYWMGVFPVTQKQYKLITGSDSVPTSQHGDISSGNADLNPVYDLKYYDVRGSDKGSKWPSSHEVDESSVLGQLRNLIDKDDIDLPTEAQWERACRGGNEGANILFSGKPLYVDGQVQSANRNEAVWCYYNSKKEGGAASETVTQEVGIKVPNAFGLYDMVGNVCEWVLDRAADFTADPETDPVGAASGNPIVRGGDVTVNCGLTGAMRSAFRFARNPSALYAGVIPGFRVSWTEE